MRLTGNTDEVIPTVSTKYVNSLKFYVNTSRGGRRHWKYFALWRWPTIFVAQYDAVLNSTSTPQGEEGAIENILDSDFVRQNLSQYGAVWQIMLGTSEPYFETKWDLRPNLVRDFLPVRLFSKKGVIHHFSSEYFHVFRFINLAEGEP